MIRTKKRLRVIRRINGESILVLRKALIIRTNVGYCSLPIVVNVVEQSSPIEGMFDNERPSFVPYSAQLGSCIRIRCRTKCTVRNACLVR